ncbi:MAG: hypothetical protein KBS96_06150 [Lachnospiraceae bacterium]|nr:hypothetical protein [Candidatus Colinaster scatohippi]
MKFKWAVLQIKRNIMSLTYWGVTIVLLLTFWICSYIERRYSEDIDVLLCSEDSIVGERVIERLIDDNIDGFRYSILDDADSMYAAIARGEATCGFVFTEDFDDAVKAMDPDGEVLLLQSSDSIDGITVREVVYPAILTCSSEVILGNYLDEVDASDEAKGEVLRKLDEILSAKSLKIYDFVNIEAEDLNKDKDNSSNVSFIIMTILLCVSVFIAGLEDYKVNNAFFKAFGRAERILLSIVSGIVNLCMFIVPLLIIYLGILYRNNL